MSSFKDKLTRFLEEERKATVDQDLLNELRAYLADETLYWDLPPERRNTLNVFFKELHSMMDGELVTGKYGANIVIDSTIVNAFEVGYRLGLSDQSEVENRDH